MKLLYIVCFYSFFKEINRFLERLFELHIWDFLVSRSLRLETRNFGGSRIESRLSTYFLCGTVSICFGNLPSCLKDFGNCLNAFDGRLLSVYYPFFKWFNRYPLVYVFSNLVTCAFLFALNLVYTCQCDAELRFI